MELTTGTILFMFVNFLLLMGVLVYFLYHPIQKILAERRQKISDDLQAAGKSRESWEKSSKEAKVAFEKAQQEALEIVNRAKLEAEKLRQEILTTAQREAEELRVKTQNEIERAKKAANAELREGAVSLALLATSKVISDQMNKELNEKLIRSTLDLIEKGANNNVLPGGA